ncbi:tRNA 2-thiouridine(34) synthase MnmA [Patescibacteria group bacterium]|nr:tRNA 2-thiouridine(34) synthase MnmA [Patescibacteria group bacterium]
MSKQDSNNNNITIAVAMSGGVDSSVSAALLKKQGYNVLGFYMKNWGDDMRGFKKSEGQWLKDREDAMRAAAKFDIRFHTLDFKKEYQDLVLNCFFSDYKKGRTPNPDVVCNEKIKFGVFLDKAVEMGADMIATGHYVRKSQIPNSNQCQLLKGIDINKDQSYFLYRLNQKQLSESMFPVGKYTKPQTRELAKKLGLLNHDKHDSQGVCFLGHLVLKDFLSRKIKEKPGDIVTKDGEKVGEHEGLFWYTIGQRKGIKVGGTGPYYVIKRDFDKNQLVVANNSKDDALYSSEVEIEDVSWISGKEPPQKCECRIRYREPLTKCAITRQDEGAYRVKFEKPQFAVASGQSLVLYQGEICLGGGIIK